MNNIRKLTRKKKGKVLLGLCAGLGDYFKIDPIIIRLALVLVFFVSSSGLALIFFYIIASLVIPYGEEEKTSV
ncbi:MAG: PspC domain-containing protein [bacterium]